MQMLTSRAMRYGMSALLLAVVLGGAYLLWGRKAASPYETIVVHPAPLTQIVSVTGKIKTERSVDLGFSISGKVSSVDAQVGQTVAAGQSLVHADSSDLVAQLAQAQAQLSGAQATLDGLKAGAQPADIAASQAALGKAQQDLTNLYTGITDSLQSGYAKANDAVRVQLNPMFSNAESSAVQLTYSSSDSQSVTNALTDRIRSAAALNDWQGTLSSLGSSTDQSTLESSLRDALLRLDTVRALIQDVSATLLGGTNLSSTTLASYKAAVTTALAEVNDTIGALNDTLQAIASQKLAVQQLQAQLELKVTGATQSQLEAQTAQVQAAAANVRTLQAKIDMTVLRAPFSGIITKQDAKVGAAAVPGVSLVSLSSTGQFQIECYVPEADIAKVVLGNPANVTLDAYGDTTAFKAKVVSIDPAETVLEGVSTYKVVLEFTTAPKPVKSGMTANVDIVTATRQSAIAIPARAVFEKNGAQYAKVVHTDGTVEDRLITTGIQGSDGALEITHGLVDGDTVVTYSNQ